MRLETHSIDPEQVMAYLDGELVPDNAAKIAQHLEQCAACAELASELRGVSSNLLSWSVEPAPNPLNDAVLSALHQNATIAGQIGNGRKLSSRSKWNAVMHSNWTWAMAGVVGLCVIGFIFQAQRKASVQPVDVATRLTASQAMNNVLLSENLEKDASDRRIAAPTPVPAPEAPATGPMIARTASLNISAADFDAARTAMDRIVRAHQGYVSTLNVSTERGAPRSFDAKLAVPAPQYDATLADLRALGRVAQEQQSSEEVSAQIVDLDARLKNARETETQLAEILRERAGKVGDVLEVEKEMARVRGEIEVMAAEQKQLHDRVAFASIELNLSEEYKAQLGDSPASVTRRMRNALVDGYRAAADGFLNIFIFFLNIGPSLLVIGAVLFFPGRWAWYRWQRSRAESAHEA
jgi:anti-sigma factor RsiW